MSKRNYSSVNDVNVNNLSQNKKYKNDFNIEIDKPIILIVRVSVKQKGQNQVSLQKQTDEILRLNKLNRNKVEILIFNGHSAYNNSYYIATMKLVFERHKNKTYYYYSIDRFSRKLSIGNEWLDLIEKNNSKIIFTTNQLSYPSDGMRLLINNVLFEAQSESYVKSVRAIQFNKFVKDNNIFQNRPGFGNSFQRRWELKTLLFIQKFLQFLNNELDLNAQQIKDYLIEIINIMPIDRSLRNQKIRFIQDEELVINKNNVNDQYDDSKDYENVCLFLNEWGIPYLKFNTKKEFIEGFFNTKKTANYDNITHCEPYLFRVLSSKEEDIHTNGQITLTDVARKLIFSNSTIYTIHHVEHITNELIELNKHNLSRNKKNKFSRIYFDANTPLLKHTILNLPNVENLIVPDVNQYKWKQKINKKFYINIEDILNNFDNNCKKHNFNQSLSNIDNINIDIMNDLNINDIDDDNHENDEHPDILNARIATSDPIHVSGGQFQNDLSASQYTDKDKYFEKYLYAKTTLGESDEKTIKAYDKFMSI